MTGLEKMQSQILQEAEQIAEARISQTRIQAEERRQAAAEESRREAGQLIAKAEREAEKEKDRVASSAELQRRTRLLEARQEIIGEVLDQAYDRFSRMDTAEYFAFLLRMAEKYALPQKGVVYFSDRDLKRLPEGYGESFAQAAEKKGGTLVIARECREIEDGFVLVYGGVEENCTLKALFAEKKESLSDRINQVMFG